MTAKTWEELYGPEAEKRENALEAHTALKPEDLDAMTKDELITLIITVGGAIWGYALMDDTHKAEAARLKLYNLGMSSNEVQKVVPALDKWFDRTSGKAPQSIAMNVKDDRMDRLPVDQLIRLAGMLDEPVIIAPLPSST